MELAVVLVGLLAAIVVVFVAVKVNRDKEGLKRLAFAGRWLGVLVLTIAINVVLGLVLGDEGLATIVSLIIMIVLSYFMSGFVVRRLSDAGWSVWLVYVTMIPLVNLLFALALMIVPPQQALKDEASA